MPDDVTTTTDQIRLLLAVAIERADLEVASICERALRGNPRAAREALDTYDHRMAAFGAL